MVSFRADPWRRRIPPAVGSSGRRNLSVGRLSQVVKGGTYFALFSTMTTTSTLRFMYLLPVLMACGGPVTEPSVGAEVSPGAETSGTDDPPADSHETTLGTVSELRPDARCTMLHRALTELIKTSKVAPINQTGAQPRLGGAVASVETANCGRWVGFVGSARPGVPLARDHRMQIGSVTKTFTAALALQLVEEGLLRLDAPVATYLPQFPALSQITLRMLLQHTSGIFDITEDADLMRRFRAHPDEEVSPEALIRAALAHPLHFKPGTSWEYSNGNAHVVGLVVERITSKPIATLFAERLTKPLSLGATVFDQGQPIYKMAEGYRAGQPVTHAFHPSVRWAAGAMVSTVDDLATWAQALGRGRPFSEPMYARMLDGVATSEPSVTWGLGPALYRSAGMGPAVGHVGSTPGFDAFIRYYRALDATVVVVANVSGGFANPIARDIETLLARHYAGTPIHEANIRYARRQGVDAKRNQLDVYTRAGNVDVPMVVFTHGGGWTSGSKESAATEGGYVPIFQEEGMVLVVPNYRLVGDPGSNGARYDEQASDIAAAIAWAHEHAEEIGANRARLFLAGHSAGAHLTALVTTSPRYLNAFGLKPSNIRGVIASDVASYHIPRAIEDARRLGFSQAADNQIRIFGPPASQWDASPIRWLERGRNCPPFLIFSASRHPDLGDQPLSRIQSDLLMNALVGVGGRAVHFHAADTGHASITQNPEVDARSRKFLRSLSK
jgi:D-alanyl-D-alanine carboxypeptidase